MLYTADKPIWHTDTKGKKDVRLVLQDDRNLVLYGVDGVGLDVAAPTPTPRRRRRPRPRPRSSRCAPVAVEEPTPPPPPPAPRTYTVVSGDTLFAIAERFYGDGNRYQEIAAASGISNPDLINIGQVVTIP